MSSIHRRSTGGRAGAWRTLLAVAALGAATAMPHMTIAADLSGSDDVLLLGPTGSRAGTPVPDGTDPPNPASIAPFDTYGRDPGLLIYTSGLDAGEGWVSWDVSAVPATDPSGPPISLAAGVAEAPVDQVELAAPPPGDWLVTGALMAGASGPEGTWAWHLVIPDRSLPEAMPAPDLVLFGGGQTVVAERGSGCYVGQCGDIGQEPPTETLPRVRLDRADEPIALTLSDGSGIATVHVAAQLLDVDESEPLTVLEGADLSTNVVLILPPPTAGGWRLTLFVTFTDGRGDQVGYARVVVPR